MPENNAKNTEIRKFAQDLGPEFLNLGQVLSVGALMKFLTSRKNSFIWFATSVLLGSSVIMPAQAAKVTKPGKVASVKVVASSKTLTLSWKAGQGGKPASYILTLTPGNKKCTTSKTTCKFSGLINGKKYSVSIVAKNSAGQSSKVTVSGTPNAPKPTTSPSPNNTPRTLNITGKVSGDLTLDDSNDTCDSYSAQISQQDAPSDLECTLRLVAILANGQMFTSTATANSKNFVIQVSSARSAQTNLTLHLLRANGAYIGPVLVKTGGYTGITSTSTAANVTLDLGTINLNTVDVDPSGTVDNRTAYGQTATSATFAGSQKVRLTGNAPAGAGKAGFVANPTITKLRIHALLSGSTNHRSYATDQDPCPDFSPKGSGTLTTDCYQALNFLLSQDPKFNEVKTAFETNCASYAGNVKATYDWLLGTAPSCASALKTISDMTSGNNGGGGGTDQGPCPGFDAQGSGTLSTECLQNFANSLSKDPAWSSIKTNLQNKCGKYGTQSNATFSWIQANDGDCFSALMDAFNAIGGGNNGGGGNSGGGGSDPCDAIQPGSDPDSDGIPNALDVDDNGDLVIDAADPAANNGCSIEPMKGIRTSVDRPLNYGLVNMSGGDYTEGSLSVDINDYLSGPDFGIGYYVYKTGFFPDAYLTDAGEMPAVWVNCSGILWCDPSTSRALLGTNVEQTNAETASGCNPSGFFDFSCNAPFNNSDYFGGSAGFADSKCGNTEQGDRAHDTPCWSEIKGPMIFGNAGNDNCQVNRFNPDYSLPAGLTLPIGASNFFWRQTCNMSGKPGQPMLRTVMGAGISPQVGRIENAPLAQNVLSPLDVLSLNYFNKSGTVSSVATTLGAYPITGPLVKTVNFNGTDEAIAYGASGSGTDKPLGAGGNGDPTNLPHAIVIQPGKKLTVTFYRPQRQAFPGEDASSAYHDVHGLSYGLEFELKNVQIGCGASSGNPDFGGASFDSSYDTPSSDFTVNNALNTGANNLAPLRDAVVDSPTELPASSTLSFTLDIAKCFQDRAEFLKTRFNETGASFASSQDLLKAMELPAGAPTDGTAVGWADETGMPTNGDTTCINMNLNGRSEAKTGGTDSSIQRLCLQFAPGSLVPVAPPQVNQQNFLSRTLGYLKQSPLGALFGR